jgi:hypothetical protein
MDGSAGRKKTYPLNAKIIELYICAASHKPFLYQRRPPQQTGDMRKRDIMQD